MYLHLANDWLKIPLSQENHLIRGCSFVANCTSLWQELYVLPGRPAGQRLASGSENDIAGDDGEHAPHGQEPPPVQFDGEVQGNHPHLDQGH